MIISFVILSILLAVIAGLSKSICDLSEEGKIKGNRFYWHKNVSWQNKWKYGNKNDGESFFGSSRWFVSFTDAWHFFGLLHRLSISASFTLIGYLISVNKLYAILFLNYVVVALSFHLLYNSKKIRL